MSKIIFIGPPGVGKTCITYRYFFGEFPDHETQPTYIAYCTMVKDALLYDTAGQERFAPINAVLVNNMDAVVIVTDADHLAEEDPLGAYVSLCESRDKSYIIALNKADLLDCNEVISCEGMLMRDFRADAVCVVSALTGDGMAGLMDAALALAERQRMKVTTKSVVVEREEESGCC